MRSFDATALTVCLLLTLATAGCSGDTGPDGSTHAGDYDRETGVMEVDEWGTFTSNIRDGHHDFEVLVREDAWESYPHSLDYIARRGDDEWVTIAVFFDEPLPLEREYSLDASRERTLKSEIQAQVDGRGYRTDDGTLTVTEVSEETIKGEFHATAIEQEEGLAVEEISGTFVAEWKILCAVGSAGSENEDGNYQIYNIDDDHDTEFCQKYTKEKVLGK